MQDHLRVPVSPDLKNGRPLVLPGLPNLFGDLAKLKVEEHQRDQYGDTADETAKRR